MKVETLKEMTVEALLDRFVTLSVKQYEAELGGGHSAFNRHYDEIDKVRNELKGRDGDQRRALLSLYEHSNMQVRLNAAKLTLAVARKAARQALEVIAASHHYPQAGDAGMSLQMLDDGIFNPT